MILKYKDNDNWNFVQLNGVVETKRIDIPTLKSMNKEKDFIEVGTESLSYVNDFIRKVFRLSDKDDLIYHGSFSGLLYKCNVALIHNNESIYISNDEVYLLNDNGQTIQRI